MNGTVILFGAAYLIVSGLLLYAMRALETERRENRATMERMARLLAAKNPMDAASAELMLRRATAANGENLEPEPQVSAFDGAFRDPPREN